MATRKGQLILSCEAKPRKRQHKSPCSDCPWARKAVAGWLGPLTPEEWVELAHSECREYCHTTSTNHECAGLAIYRANVFKVLRDPTAFQLPADRVKVFGSPAEFLAHHKQVPHAPRV